MFNSGTRTRQPKIAPNAPRGGGGPGGFKSAQSTGVQSAQRDPFQESKNNSLSPAGRNTRADLPKKSDKPSNQQIRAKWNLHDGLIQKVAAEFNQKFQSKSYNPPFIPVDWKIIKAMVWVESSGPDVDKRNIGFEPHPIFYSSDPMQFGNDGDPGLAVIRDAKEHSELISSKELRIQLKGPLNAELSIRGGTALLFQRGAIFERLEVIDNPQVKQYIVKDGDIADNLKDKLRTTLDELKKMNNTKKFNVANIHRGDVLLYRELHDEWFLTGWEDWWTAVKEYNGGGDPHYLSKVKDAYQAILNES